MPSRAAEAVEIRDSDVSEGEADEVLGIVHDLDDFTDTQETDETPDTSDLDFVENGYVSDQYLLDSNNEDDLFYPSHPVLGVNGNQGQQVVPVASQPAPAQHGLGHFRRSPSTSEDDGDDDADEADDDDGDDDDDEDGKPPQDICGRWRPVKKRPLEDTSDEEDGEIVCRKRAVPTFHPYRLAFHSSDEDRSLSLLSAFFSTLFAPSQLPLAFHSDLTAS